ncbi:MAG: VCBS repeat-containing protein [Candidatus Hydrogenedentes bacterium]|nr:VCBS repeat-containing protein [Candidatus Hydrogenedentota bacterium]
MMRMILVFTMIFAVVGVAEEATLHFEKMRIGTANFEAASIFDVDNDGVKDLFSGGFWYKGPDFKTAHKVTEIQAIQNYFDDFSNIPVDVNGDGLMDIITGGWWGLTLQWRENPGNTGEWITHDIAEVGNIERTCPCDFDNDGYPEFIPVVTPVSVFKLIRDEDGKGTGRFEKYVISGGTGGHGLGCGDINGDGRNDIILAGGWLEAPEDPYQGDAWIWHEEFELDHASLPILVYDVNGDGLNDLIYGAAHDYGLWWMEQGKDEAGKRSWTRHDIDTERSQYHDLRLVDLDNDGKLELITGKRYYAHNGSDPGADDPIGLYYFKIDGTTFTRHTIDYGEAGKASGAGIYFWVDDVDGNGWQDILAPGKDGLYLFLNQGFKDTN